MKGPHTSRASLIHVYLIPFSRAISALLQAGYLLFQKLLVRNKPDCLYLLHPSVLLPGGATLVTL